MKAILCTRYGTPDDLELADMPDPIAGPGEVVVEVAAAALNFFDTLIIAGKYQFKPAFPFSPAAEFAGVVESVGAGVTGCESRRPGHGLSSAMAAARERLAVTRPSKLVKLPDNLDFDRAAGLIVTYGTTIHALKDRAQLKPGETLAVLGAAGGIGLAAVELGKADGCARHRLRLVGREIAFAQTAWRRRGDQLRDATICATRSSASAASAASTSSTIRSAAPMRKPALRSMAWEGRYLVVGFAAGEIPKLPLNLVLLKGCDVRRRVLGLLRRARAGRPVAPIWRRSCDWCAEGKLSAHVHAVYPLAETAQALKDIAARKIMGKAILRP